MFKIENMTNDNLKNVESSENTESSKLENNSVEKPEEVKEEISEKIEKEVERIKNGDQEINDSLCEDNSLEADGVREESKEIVDEGEDIGSSAKEEADEIISEEELIKVETDVSEFDTDELKREIEEGMKEEEQEYKDRIAERKNEWEEKSEEEKKKEIKEYKEEIEKDPRMIEVQEKMKSEAETMEEYIEKLRKETENIVKNRASAMAVIQEQLNRGVNIPELSGIDQINQKEARAALDEMSRIANNRLTNEKLNYLLQFENDFGDLLNEHKNREITIEKFEEIVRMIENFEECLREFEEMGEEEQKEAREEIEGLIGWLKEIHRKNPELWKYLLATGLVAGTIVLASVFGVPVSGLEVPWRDIAIVGTGLVAAGSGLYLTFSKKMAGTRSKLKEGGKLLSGGLLGGALLLADYMLKGENWDKGMEFVTGLKVHRWARSEPEKSS